MKLTKSQKQDRKFWKSYLETDGGHFEYTEGHTFVIIPHGNTAQVSCAILDPLDYYNRKYGEWLALSRMYREADNMLMPYKAY